MPQVKTYARMNTNDPGEIAEFERALFLAFEPTLDLPGLDLIWDVDLPARRIRQKVPYANLWIQVVRLDGVFMAAGVVNLDVKTPWQIEMLGFTIDKTEPGICEVLVIFNNQRLLGDTSMSIVDAIGVKIIEDIKPRYGIQKMYATCGTPKLENYLLWGWREMGHRDFSGSREHLLEVRI
jgi:hypothetical protein